MSSRVPLPSQCAKKIPNAYLYACWPWPWRLSSMLSDFGAAQSHSYRQGAHKPQDRSPSKTGAPEVEVWNVWTGKSVWGDSFVDWILINRVYIYIFKYIHVYSIVYTYCPPWSCIVSLKFGQAVEMCKSKKVGPGLTQYVRLQCHRMPAFSFILCEVSGAKRKTAGHSSSAFPGLEWAVGGAQEHPFTKIFGMTWVYTLCKYRFMMLKSKISVIFSM